MEAFPSLSGRFVRPFAVVLARHPGLRSTAQHLQKVPLEDRLGVQSAFESVAQWVAESGDADLGLKAALEMAIGCAGLLDYAMRSAGCLRDAFTLVQDYGWHFSDSLQIEWVERGSRTVLRLDHDPPPPRAVIDFTLGTWFRSHMRSQLDGVSAIDCYFSYPPPESTSLHRRVFAGAGLHFDAGFDGFSFDSRALDHQLPATSPMLHVLHCELLEGGSNALRGPTPTAARVRQLVASALRHGQPTATEIARKLHMSRRTLVRRLMGEGTSFSQLVSEVRRALALRYARMEGLPISEISVLLGFAQAQPFHRLFRRWTGTTPLQYRKQIKRAESAAAARAR
jgi:AraC-like DNA-binding protein